MSTNIGAPTFVPVTVLPPGQLVRITGPLLVGYLLHWGLFAALSIQIYLYYEAFPNDRKSTKLLVYGVFLIEAAQTGIVTNAAFDTFAYGFGNVAALTDMHLSWLTIPILSAIVASVGQTFYAYRVWILSKRIVIPIGIVIVSVLSTVCGIVTGALTSRGATIDVITENKSISTMLGIWLAASAANDIIIASCMTYYLLKSSTGIRQTNVLISKLVRLTIETGSITALFAIISLILWFGFPGQAYYTCPTSLMAKLYSNTMMVVLNARIKIAGGRGTYTSVVDMASTGATLGRFRASPAVHVSVSKEAFNARGQTESELEMKRVGQENTFDSQV
ncbi:hypothetical protein DFH06DRAFT_1200129 [Mycena polygramma]|nr:hypothetical protein DFH06DRAFT_1200129 [Mycena polygramma]